MSEPRTIGAPGDLFRSRRDIGPMAHERLSARAAALGTTIHAVATRIGMDPSVPSRWAKGTTPSLVTYLALDAELAQMALDDEREVVAEP